LTKLLTRKFNVIRQRIELIEVLDKSKKALDELRKECKGSI